MPEELVRLVEGLALRRPRPSVATVARQAIPGGLGAGRARASPTTGWWCSGGCARAERGWCGWCWPVAAGRLAGLLVTGGDGGCPGRMCRRTLPAVRRAGPPDRVWPPPPAVLALAAGPGARESRPVGLRRHEAVGIWRAAWRSPRWT